MKKRMFSLILACLMLVPVLIACNDKNGDGANNATESGTEGKETVGGEYAYIDEYVNSLAEEYDFNGSSFTMLCNGTDYPEKDEITGVLEDDALYNRYRELEELFGIEVEKLVQTAEGTTWQYDGEAVADRVKIDVMSGGSSYDWISGGVMASGMNMLNNGCIRPVNEMEGIDLSKSWWTRGIEESLSISGKLYFLTGKIVTSHYSTPTCMIFSKKLAEDYGMAEDIYEVVERGEWTIDKLNEYASVVPTNSAGTGVYRYLVSGAYGGLSFYVGAGYSVSEMNEEGSPEISSALTSEQINYIDSLKTFLGDHSQNVDSEKHLQELGYPEEYDMFAEGDYLFTLTEMGHLARLRETSDMEVGVVPNPKKDVNQEEYYSFSSGWAMYGVFFSQNLKDEEMAGVITEAMAALSEKHLEPAYYEKALQGRSTYDIESRKMLNIIYSGETVDIAEICKWGDVAFLINEACLGTREDLASSYGSAARLANRRITAIEKTIQKQKLS